jgi:predicted Fe-S protein YdhL (DUF1289 family)
MEKMDYLFARLQRSTFARASILAAKSGSTVSRKGRRPSTSTRRILLPAVWRQQIANDGKQTPMRGHPVFIAQHATATCCRGCLAKWHDIPAGRELTDREQQYVVQVIHRWLVIQMNSSAR